MDKTNRGKCGFWILLHAVWNDKGRIAVGL